VPRVPPVFGGGATPNPTYELVCPGAPGHAEVVQITFDPREVTYREILEVFFTIHDPTTPNRQGGDVGTQYRSAIFYHSPEQEETAESVMKELVGEGLWRDPVVTELVPLDHFYPAETYHDEYFRTHPNQPYCRAVIEPKVAKFRKKYLDRLKG
jgi:peptide-methionine (S)-S-oxide reductase